MHERKDTCVVHPESADANNESPGRVAKLVATEIQRARPDPRRRRKAARRVAPWLSVAATIAPFAQCAVCPACLAVFGSLVAGARLGLLVDERLHGMLIVCAIVLDTAILTLSKRHYRQFQPLALCVAGALLSLLAHFVWSSLLLEYTGFGLLMAASLWNVALLRAHRHAADSCCPHHDTMGGA
jgi:hypothetical protein